MAPSIEPSTAPPDDYQRIPTSPRQFGVQVGQGEEALGAGALKAADFYDRAASEQAYTQLQHESDNLLYGDPNNPADKGFMGLSGEDAMKARPAIRAQLDQIHQRIKDSLITGKSQLDFDAAGRRLNSYNFSRIESHYEQQSKVWGISTSDAGMAANERTVANNYNDNERFLHALEDQNGLAVKGAQLSGKSATGSMAEGQSRLVLARINGALAQNDFTTANQVFKEYGNLLDDKLRPTIAGHLRANNLRADADTLLRNAQSPDFQPGAPSSSPSGVVGQSQRSGGWGPLAEPAIAAFRTGGASDAFIHGAMANGLGEGGFKEPWQQSWVGSSGQREESFGHWQLNKNGELPAYLASEGAANPQDTAAQAKFLMRRMEELHPGITKSTDARAVTDAIATQFEKYQGAAPGQRYGQLAEAQRQMGSVPAGGAPGKFDMAGGDSIGVGHIRSAGLGGVAVDDVRMPDAALADAVGSRNPQQALDFIRTHPNRFAGKTVLWSSGLMNASDPRASLATVGEQLDALKAVGATPVLAGVDQGKFAPYNAELKTLADARGVPFAGPLPTSNVHSSPQGYKDYAASAAKLLPTPAPVDQMQGQPPAPAGVRPAGNAGAAIPAGLPGPGVAEIAAAQSALAVAHARTLANIAASGAEPQVMQAAETRARLEYQSKELALTGQMKALQEQRNLTADGFVQRMIKGPIDARILDDLAADPRLDHTTRENLVHFYNAEIKGTAAGYTKDYGPKFLETYARLSLPNDDPQKIRDPSQIYAMGPKADGSMDLSLHGVAELTRSLDELRKRDPAIAEKKRELMNLVMPMDKALEEYSLPQRQQRYNFNWDIDEHIRHQVEAGKNPYDLFDPNKPDYLGKPYLAKIEASELAAKLQADKSLKTEAGIVAARKAGKLTREEAAQALRNIGVQFIEPPAAAPAPPLR